MKQFKIAEEGGYSVYEIPTIDKIKFKEVLEKNLEKVAKTKYFFIQKLSETQALIQLKECSDFGIIKYKDLERVFLNDALELTVTECEVEKEVQKNFPIFKVHGHENSFTADTLYFQTYEELLKKNEEHFKTLDNVTKERILNFSKDSRLNNISFSYYFNSIDNEIEIKYSSGNGISFCEFSKEGYYKNRDYNYDLNTYEIGSYGFEEFFNKTIDYLLSTHFKGTLYKHKNYVFNDEILIIIENESTPSETVEENFKKVIDLHFINYDKSEYKSDNRFYKKKIKAPKNKEELSKEEFVTIIRNYLLTPDKED